MAVGQCFLEGRYFKALAFLLVFVGAVPGIRELVVVRKRPSTCRVHFKGLKEFEQFARHHGLFLHSGGRDSRYCGLSFFVGDHPLTFEELQAIPTRQDCGLTPAWSGIVRVTDCNDDLTGLGTTPDSIGGKWRILGNVLVAGDEKLMDYIEELYNMGSLG